jgi:hypothetical protein
MKFLQETESREFLRKVSFYSSLLVICNSQLQQKSLSRAEVAQLVEHLTENQRVPSSSLGLGTFTAPKSPAKSGGAFFVFQATVCSGQHNDKLGTRPILAGHCDFTPVQFYDGPGNGQPQPRSVAVVTAGRIGPVETIEYVG